jgi:hypothetical protein
MTINFYKDDHRTDDDYCGDPSVQNHRFIQRVHEFKTADTQNQTSQLTRLDTNSNVVGEVSNFHVFGECY